MQLLQSWRDSLQLLKPKNFKQFCLLVINNMMRTVLILTGRCWPLGFFLLSSSLAAGLVIEGCVLFLFCLLSRASIEIKDKYYLFIYCKKYFFRSYLILFIVHYLGKLALIVFFLIFIAGVSVAIADAQLYIEMIATYTQTNMYIFTFVSNFITIMKGLALFFLLDNGLQPHRQKGLYIKSIKRAVYMVWYNLPIFVLCALIAVGVYMLELPLWISVANMSLQSGITVTFVASGIVWFIHMWIAIATLSTLYTKLLYENPRLYIDSK